MVCVGVRGMDRVAARVHKALTLLIEGDVLREGHGRASQIGGGKKIQKEHAHYSLESLSKSFVPGDMAVDAATTQTCQTSESSQNEGKKTRTMH